MTTDDPTQPLLSGRANNNSLDPLPSPPIPFPKRLLDFLTVWTLKSIVRTYTTILHILSLLRLRPRPNLTRTYATAPHNPVRIFLPSQNSNNDSSSPPPPLLISIHGGGFALGAPTIDDADALIYATTHRIAVATIGYRLAPRARFPAAVHDAAAVIAAILSDASLPVDRARAAVCGYSAGGNLALASTQLLAAGPRRRVRAAVAFYPVVDFSLDHAHRVARARAHPATRGAPNQRFGWVRWAYVPRGRDLRDPLLSPVFAARDALPRKVCLVGCERDMLCAEAEEMAEELATAEGEGPKRVEGEGAAWRTANVRWEKVLGQVHGFNQMVGFGEGARTARRKTEEMHAGVARWLWEEVFVEG